MSASHYFLRKPGIRQVTGYPFGIVSFAVKVERFLVMIGSAKAAQMPSSPARAQNDSFHSRDPTPSRLAPRGRKLSDLDDSRGTLEGFEPSAM